MSYMTDERKPIKTVIVAAFLGVLTLIACGQVSDTADEKKIDVAEWSEEVMLHDGRIVVIQRKERRFAAGFPNSHRGALIDAQVTFPEAHLTWTHEQSKSSIRLPISFEIFDQQYYLVLYAADRSFCNGKSPDTYLVQILKWEHGQWIEVSPATFPLNKSLINLTDQNWGRTSAQDAHDLLRWNDKKSVGDDLGASVEAFFEHYHRTCRLFQRI